MRGLAATFAELLSAPPGRPGLAFQAVRPCVFANYQNFAVPMVEAGFGPTCDRLSTVLQAENIASRKHRHDAYRAYRDADLPVTERVSSRVLCLPIYSEMSDDVLDRLCLAIERIHTHAPEVRRHLSA